jgi:hypothetical protein
MSGIYYPLIVSWIVKPPPPKPTTKPAAVGSCDGRNQGK